ncbi:isoprenylcysteine carboxylmethyltransferase family protein [Mycobacterium ahvazicum]|uniref:Isoprenylcysteine carboxylmethyltransferase family protein n=1 Tax=Mycobacterium ahvazicum TaxID=1964395 RepID=A0A2K4YFD9_9MYCO|nr:isoprenylcysteine carboxylmethyltransferase family protein [Mycobacterium ahvazicum]SOX55498.1 isoprenylcysteine carboxylmethyltransferase family protein [Mycobacterium ahvazicum]
MNTGVRATASSVFGLAVLGLLLFLPAGTLNYWQAWAFIATTLVATILPTVYIGRTNPAALERRMHAGPKAETRVVQKVVMVSAFTALIAMLVFSAYDHRMNWSSVPGWVSVFGDALVAIGLGIAMLVIVQNAYAAATVTVESGQTLVSSGVYKYVRHPMYVGNFIMMIGIPLSLGSYWGLLFVIPGQAVIVFRILDEEKLLTEQLPGYREYTQHVRYRLLPYVW